MTWKYKGKKPVAQRGTLRPSRWCTVIPWLCSWSKNTQCRAIHAGKFRRAGLLLAQGKSTRRRVADTLAPETPPGFRHISLLLCGRVCRPAAEHSSRKNSGQYFSANQKNPCSYSSPHGVLPLFLSHCSFHWSIRVSLATHQHGWKWLAIMAETRQHLPRHSG